MTNGISPKVAYPGYVIFIGTVVTCALHAKGVDLDPGVVVGTIGSIALFIGWAVKHTPPATTRETTTTTTTKGTS